MFFQQKCQCGARFYFDKSRLSASNKTSRIRYTAHPTASTWLWAARFNLNFSWLDTTLKGHSRKSL